jgi:hypothetical protein
MASAKDLTAELTAKLSGAIELALSGDWDGAHKIVQSHEDDATSCWIHAVLHKIEGDAANSRYWYGQAKRAYEDFSDPKTELAAIRSELAQI